jgi:hypothetical protein
MGGKFRVVFLPSCRECCNSYPEKSMLTPIPEISAEFTGFAFKVGDTSPEMQALVWFANYHRIPRQFFRRADEVPTGWIPSGGVPWCSQVLGFEVRPNYFPDFLNPWIYRKVWQTDEWPLGQKVFIKPADRHKRFNGYITSGTFSNKKRGPYWCSEIVQFTNEWRYYVSGGNVIGAYWYAGDENLMPVAPALPDIQFPANWCGTVDFGILGDGRLALVEAHPPFAVGWYGKIGDGEPYARWLADGWRWISANKAQLITS